MTNILPLAPGTLIGGHYIIGALLNTGGFGAVYRGIDTSEGHRPCAIKETYDVTPAARRQALTEAAVLFTVRSARLPQVYDAFEGQGRFYLVMQLIEGQNLLELSKRHGRPCSEQEVLHWLLPVIDVLQELHSRNPAVIHRDIKPGNIILTPQATAALVDFGLTRLYDPSSDTHTLVRAVSEGFSPIEQYIGRTSPQSDIYSLAATMYYLLTQTVPPASVHRGYHDELIAPRLLNPNITPNTEQVLLKALAVDADQRYASMHEFARALRQPVFTGYADQTIVDSRVRAAIAPAQASFARPSMPSLAPVVAVPPVFIPSQPQPARPYSSGRERPRPTPAGQAASHPVYPVLPPHPQKAARAPVVPTYRALPSPFSQGCLWGLLQGVCAALIILSLKKEVYFYLAIFEGLFFYLLAGFFTARKGGSSFRGAWAGFWSGIFSTIVFWAVLLVGILVLWAQRIQFNANAARLAGQPFDPKTAPGRAFQQVVATFGIYSSTQTQQGNSSLTVLLIGGLLCAMVLGWIGGMLGTSRFKRKNQVLPSITADT